MIGEEDREDNEGEEDEEEEIVFLAPGLYETGTTTMIKSWEELKNENLITLEGATLKEIDWDLVGDLVISNEIENLSSYYKWEEKWIEGEVEEEGDEDGYWGSVTYSLKLTAVYIPSSIKTIPQEAFRNAESLNKVVIQNGGVTIIGYDAFLGCSSLTNVTIPESVTSLINGAFSFCNNLTSIDIPKSLTNIEIQAFFDCENLASINVDSDNEVYSSENGILYNKDKTQILIYPDGKLEETYIIPESVTSVGFFAFRNNNKLTSITLPNNMILDMSDLDMTMFSMCHNLKNINVNSDNEIYSSENGILFNKDKTKIIAYPKGRTEETYIIPEGVTSIGSSAFYNCSKLTNIVIPEGVTSIEEYAFYDCRGLTSITIPVSLKSIGDSAFYECDMDLEINYAGTEEQWNQINIEWGNFAITKEEEEGS